MAPQTVDSDAPPFAQPGKARDLSHANPVCIEIPVTVQGSRNNPPGAASSPVPQPFIEETRTVLAFEQGAVLRMSETTVAGQILILKNSRLNREAACRVVNYKARDSVKGYVEVEFLEPAPGFWGIAFPAPPAGRAAPTAEQPKAADQPKADAPRLSPPTAALQAPPAALKPQSAGVPLLPDLLPAESQSKTVSSREPSPTSLFGWEPPQTPPSADKPTVTPQPPAAVAKPAQAAPPQGRPGADPASLSDLLDSLTPLGEQVLLGKNSGPGSANTSIRKTPVPLPTSFPAAPVTPATERPLGKRSTDYSLQVTSELIGSDDGGRATSRPSPDFERPAPALSGESVFSSLPKKQHSSAVLGGPIFSAGEPESTSSSTGGRKTWVVVGAIALLLAGGGGYGYYRFHARTQAPAAPAVAVTVPAPPPPSPHDVTAPVDTTPGASTSQPAPAGADSLPASAPETSQPQTPAANAASTPAPVAAPRTAPPSSASRATTAQQQPPAPAAPQPAPRSQTPANLKLSSPTVTSSQSPSEEAPSISSDVAGSIPGGATSSIGGIAPSNSGPAEPPRPKTDFHEPQLISSVPPAYPDIARRQNVQGDVVVDLAVDENGRVTEARVVSGPGLLREAAIEALRKNKYKPASLDGKPAAAHVTVTVHFKTQ